MVRVSVEVFELESVAVMVKVFMPEIKVMFEMFQELSVRVAVPEPPLSLAQVTLERLILSVALPERLKALDEVE